MVKAQTHYTKELMLRFARFNSRKQSSQIITYVILELLLFSFALMFIVTSENLLEFFISIGLITPLCLALIPVIVLLTPYLVAKMSGNVIGAINTYEFNENEFVIESSLPTLAGQTKISLSHLVRVYETRDAFYLYISKMQAFIINKNDIIEGNLSDLQEIFRSHLPAKTYVVGNGSKMKKVIAFGVALLIGFTLVSCSTIKFFDLNNSNENELQSVKSSETNLTLQFPKSWKEYELNEIATIQMANMAKEQYFVIIEETAGDFTDDFTVGDYTNIIMENMMAVVETEEDPVINDVKIGENIDAKQFEMTGAVEKVKVKYLVTCAEVDGYFCQIIAWSLQSKYDKNKPVFEEIINSVKLAE